MTYCHPQNAHWQLQFWLCLNIACWQSRGKSLHAQAAATRDTGATNKDAENGILLLGSYVEWLRHVTWARPYRSVFGFAVWWFNAERAGPLKSCPHWTPRTNHRFYAIIVFPRVIGAVDEVGQDAVQLFGGCSNGLFPVSLTMDDRPWLRAAEWVYCSAPWVLSLSFYFLHC